MAVSLRGGKQHHLCRQGTFSEWQDLIFFGNTSYVYFTLFFFCWFSLVLQSVDNRLWC